MALQSVCSESASFDLPAGVLASCVQEVQSALEIALVRREDGAAQRGGEIFVAGAGTCSQLHVMFVSKSLRCAFAVLVCTRPCDRACYAADGEGKVNYFEMATNLRTLKVR